MRSLTRSLALDSIDENSVFRPRMKRDTHLVDAIEGERIGEIKRETERETPQQGLSSGVYRCT